MRGNLRNTESRLNLYLLLIVTQKGVFVMAFKHILTLPRHDVIFETNDFFLFKIDDTINFFSRHLHLKL